MMRMNSAKTKKNRAPMGLGKETNSLRRGNTQHVAWEGKNIKIKKKRQGRTLIKHPMWMQENTQRSPPPHPCHPYDSAALWNRTIGTLY